MHQHCFRCCRSSLQVQDNENLEKLKKDNTNLKKYILSDQTLHANEVLYLKEKISMLESKLSFVKKMKELLINFSIFALLILPFVLSVLFLN